MNPHSLNTYNTNANLNQRDKINSYLEPNRQNNNIGSYTSSNIASTGLQTS